MLQSRDLLTRVVPLPSYNWNKDYNKNQNRIDALRVDLLRNPLRGSLPDSLPESLRIPCDSDASAGVISDGISVLMVSVKLNPRHELLPGNNLTSLQASRHLRQR